MNEPALNDQSADLEKVLLALARFGKPRISMLTSGWYCVVEMNTNTTGTSFEVKSDAFLNSPTKAARQCLDRVHGALRALGGA